MESSIGNILERSLRSPSLKFIVACNEFIIDIKFFRQDIKKFVRRQELLDEIVTELSDFEFKTLFARSDL